MGIANQMPPLRLRQTPLYVIFPDRFKRLIDKFLRSINPGLFHSIFRCGFHEPFSEKQKFNNRTDPLKLPILG